MVPVKFTRAGRRLARKILLDPHTVYMYSGSVLARPLPDFPFNLEVRHTLYKVGRHGESQCRVFQNLHDVPEFRVTTTWLTQAEA
jgi:hypothetical protein